MNIVLLDTNSLGHHFTYQVNYTKVLLGLGHQVALLSPCSYEVKVKLIADGIESAESVVVGYYRLPVLMGNAVIRSRFVLLRKLHSLFLHLLKFFRVRLALRRIYKSSQFKADLVFFLVGDQFLDLARYRSMHYVLSRLIQVPWSGLFFGTFKSKESSLPQAGNSHISCRNRMTYIARQKHLVFGCLNEETLSFYREIFPSSSNLVTFPDTASLDLPHEDLPCIRSLRRLARGRPIVCLVGIVSERKGAFVFIETAELSAASEFFFVMAGPILANTERLADRIRLWKTRENVLVLDEHLNEQTINAIIAISNMVYLAYENFDQSSNVLTKAAAFHVPVIVSDGELIARRTKKFGLGIVLRAKTPLEVVNALEKLTLPTNDSFETGSRGNGTEYAKLHSIEELKKSCRIVFGDKDFP